MRKRSGLVFLVIGAALLLFLLSFLFQHDAEKSSASRDMKMAEQDVDRADPDDRRERTVDPVMAREEPQPPPDEPEQKTEIIAGDRDTTLAPSGLEERNNERYVAERRVDAPKGSARPKRKPKTRTKSAELRDGMVGFFGGGGPANRGPGTATNEKTKERKKTVRRPSVAKKSDEKPRSRRPRKVRSLRERRQWVLGQEDLDAIGTGKDGKQRDLLGKLGAVNDIYDRRPDSDPRSEDEGILDLFGDGERTANKGKDQHRAPRTKMTETSVDPKSTFAIDVDTGSYTLARARMREGYPPRKDDVRIEEFVNYFHYDYPQPVEGEFAVAMEAAPDPLSTHPRRHLVRIGVQGKSVPTEDRPPAHLTFLVDVSGSMFGPDQLGLVIESLDLVTRNLRPEDTIAVVEYATEAEVTMWPAGASERDIISRTIATLEPGGSSALDKGLDLAYQVASTHYVAGHINRVVLLGDGRANAGETRPEKLLESVRFGVEDGVELSTIGFGARAFNDRMMEQLADRGNGAYYFVDSYREAQKVFGDYLCGTLFTIAKDVKIQVEFNPKSVVRHRLLGYENRELQHHEFRNDAIDAGEIGAGHSVTAIYEVDLTEQPDTTLATVSVRYKKPGESRASELNFQLFSEELITDVRQASPDFKFAAAVAMYAEVARGTMPSNEARISLIREIAGEGTPRPDEQPDRAEFLALVDETAMFFVN